MRDTRHKEKLPVNLILQWVAFHKFAADNKLKASIIAVYNALLYFANEKYWEKEVEITLSAAKAQAGVDKTIFYRCMETLYAKGLLESWIKGSNRYTKARFTLKRLYLDGDKSDAINNLPCDLSQQVDGDKSDAINNLPCDLSQQVDGDKSEHLIKQVNNSLIIKTNKNATKSAYALNAVIDKPWQASERSGFQSEKEKSCAEKERDNPVDVEQIPSPLDIAVLEFVEMRKKIRKPLTARAMQLVHDTLDRLAGSDEGHKVKILNQSIVNCWQDVFPLRAVKNVPGTAQQARDEKKASLRMIVEQSVDFLQRVNM